MYMSMIVSEMKKPGPNLVFEPVAPGDNQGQVEDPRCLLTNFTELSVIVKFSNTVKSEKVKPLDIKKKYNELDEEELEDPEVYFTVNVSCDVEPEEIGERVVQEWRKRGGNKLEVSELQCLETGPAMVFYNMYNEGNLNTIRAEAHRLMKQVAKHKKGTEMTLDTTDADAGGDVNVPAITLSIKVPKIPGLGTSQFKDWHWKDANKRKAIHVMCNVEEVSTVQTLFEVSKAQKNGRFFFGQECAGQQGCSIPMQEEERSVGRGG